MSIDQAAWLRTIWPQHTVKLAARAAGCSPDTAKGWVSGRHGMGAETLWRMAQNDPNLRRAWLAALKDMEAAAGGSSHDRI